MSIQYSRKSIPTVCRTCLASDGRLLPIKSVPHLDIIKKLTRIGFNIEGRPRVLCEDCFQKLQICSEFCDLANRSESIFKELLSKGIEATPENITKLNQSMIQSASVSPKQITTTEIEHCSITEEISTELVKGEPDSETEDELSVREDEPSVNYDISVKEHKVSVKDNELLLNLERTAVANITEEKPYACTICDKRFSWKSYVLKHMKIHTGERPFVCHICDKHFIDRYKLVEHMRIHTDPYVCTICDKEFTQNSGLERHMRVHTGEKPYACTECDERFTQKSSLIGHERIHTGEKPYPCKSCGKHFAKKSTLVRHTLIHTGEKPYPCKSCGKHFAKTSTLVRHVRIHTGEKPYVCNKCHKGYTRKSTLEKHKRNCKSSK